MSKTAVKMTGIILMIISVFPLYGGLMVQENMGVDMRTRLLLILGGLTGMVAGVVLFKIIKSDVQE